MVLSACHEPTESGDTAKSTMAAVSETTVVATEHETETTIVTSVSSVTKKETSTTTAVTSKTEEINSEQTTAAEGTLSPDYKEWEEEPAVPDVEDIMTPDKTEKATSAAQNETVTETTQDETQDDIVTEKVIELPFVPAN